MFEYRWYRITYLMCIQYEQEFFFLNSKSHVCINGLYPVWKVQTDKRCVILKPVLNVLEYPPKLYTYMYLMNILKRLLLLELVLEIKLRRWWIYIWFSVCMLYAYYVSVCWLRRSVWLCKQFDKKIEMIAVWLFGYSFLNLRPVTRLPSIGLRIISANMN